MLLVFSHVLAFSVLFVGSIWDLYTTEVPDHLSVIGVLGGIGLHLAYSLQLGSFEPLVWSMGAGAILSLFGWGMYFLGMWGGADAFAMSVLGFAAPFGLEGIGALHLVNLFVNIMLVGFVYTLGFAFYRGWKTEGIVENTCNRLKEDEKRISVEIMGAAALAAIMQSYGGFNGYIYFSALLGMVVLYRFLKVLEEHAMTRKVKVEDLRGGEVPASGQGLGKKIRGISEEDIEGIDMEEIEIKSGIKFVPVFPVALLLTDAFNIGIKTVLLFFSL